MESHLFALCSHKMIDNVAARCISTPITEPLFAGVAVHHTGRVMDTTVTASMHRKILCIVSIFFIFFKIQLCQKLAGFSYVIIHCSILQNAIRSINLEYKVSA